MDNTTENSDMLSAAEFGGENSDNQSLAEGVSFDSEANFNLDDILDASQSEFGDVLDIKGEEEKNSTDLDMEKWLSGIDENTDNLATDNIMIADNNFSPDNEDVVFDDLGNLTDISSLEDEKSISPIDDGEYKEDALVADFTENERQNSEVTVSEEEVSVVDEVAEDSVVESGWLVENTEEQISENNVAGGWLSETEDSLASEVEAEEPIEDGNVDIVDNIEQIEENVYDTVEKEVVVANEEDTVNENSWLVSDADDEINSLENVSATDYSSEEKEVGEESFTESENYSTDVSLTTDNCEDFNEVNTSDAVYSLEQNFVKWYSGSVHDEIFEIFKNQLPEVVEGNSDCKIIHINVGYDTYGWLIEFDGGLTMSLDDVRKYQIKNGMLPATSGAIRYGTSCCRFSQIERILIYQSVRYFSYGA